MWNKVFMPIESISACVGTVRGLPLVQIQFPANIDRLPFPSPMDYLRHIANDDADDDLCDGDLYDMLLSYSEQRILNERHFSQLRDTLPFVIHPGYLVG